MIVHEFRKVTYANFIDVEKQYILGADIGGTNSNFGFFDVSDDTLKLCFSWHYKSHEINDFTKLVADLLVQVKAEYGIIVERACFAAAGVVMPDQNFCKPTNLSFAISSRELIDNSFLICAPIVNDFSVIGYGLSHIAEKDLVHVYSGTEHSQANKAIIGAGTGLGKSILRWVHSQEQYVPVASEGGHADCAVQTEEEFALMQYIKQKEQRSCNISWEDLLSGHGIQRMYHFFARDAVYSDETVLNPDEIFACRNENRYAYQTIELYTKLYARCAKNFALDALALGGVYIAGGIAAKNIELFKLSIFYQEFINCGKQDLFLKDIPVWVITDYNVSLYGAACYILQRKKIV